MSGELCPALAAAAAGATLGCFGSALAWIASAALGGTGFGSTLGSAALGDSAALGGTGFGSTLGSAALGASAALGGTGFGSTLGSAGFAASALGVRGSFASPTAKGEPDALPALGLVTLAVGEVATCVGRTKMP